MYEILSFVPVISMLIMPVRMLSGTAGAIDGEKASAGDRCGRAYWAEGAAGCAGHCAGYRQYRCQAGGGHHGYHGHHGGEGPPAQRQAGGACAGQQ